MTRPRFAPGSTAFFSVKQRSGKIKLARYLAARLGVVEPWAADLVDNGLVKLDGMPTGPGECINLSAGPHTMEVTFPEAWPRHMAATEMALDIVYEDEHVVGLNKEAGRVVHPARGHLDNQTMQNGMRHRYRHLLGREDATIGPPHRLDKDTSGVILFSLTRSGYTNLVNQFSTGKPHKEYIAVASGNPDFSELTCNLPIGPDPDHRGRGKILGVERGGKTARTDFRVLEKGNGWAAMLAVPHTGRAHQIRIHAAALGLPLLADAEYNARPGEFGFHRQALHASVLCFSHPFDGRPMRIEAPLPDDMRLLIRRLRGTE